MLLFFSYPVLQLSCLTVSLASCLDCWQCSLADSFNPLNYVYCQLCLPLFHTLCIIQISHTKLNTWEERLSGGSCGECCRALSSPNSTTIQQLRPSRRPHSFTHWSAPLIPSTCLHFIINKHPVIIFSHYFCHVFNPPHFAVMRGPVYGPLVFLLVWFTTNWIHWIYLKKKAACFSNLNQFFALFIIFIVVKVLSVCI